MANFHISRADGMVRQCKAQPPETCRADTPQEIKEHFTNKEDAEQAYAKVMEESRGLPSLAKRNGGKMSKRVILGSDNITRPVPKDPAVKKGLQKLKKTEEERKQDRIIREIDEKRNTDTAELEASVFTNINKLERTNYVIENIDSYDGLPGGKEATLVQYTREASNLAKNIFEASVALEKFKSLFSHEQLNRHKENYMNQIELEEKAIKGREKDLKRRYGFFQRKNDPDSKLVYNDNMSDLNNRKQEIQKEQEQMRSE